MPHLTPLPSFSTTHFHTIHFLSLASSFTSLLFFFFFSFSHTLLSTLIFSTSTSTPPPPFPPSFSGKITGKFLGTHKHLHILFEVKISNLFCGFYTFAWGYFYLSFNNDIHVIYEHWKWYLCVFMYGFCIGLMSVYILCAIDDYLRFMYGGKFRGFKS